MKAEKEITCRYGVAYKTELKGTKGEIARAVEHLKKCCCWTCYNHNCKSPKNERLDKCGTVCELWTNLPYCNRT